MNVMLVRFGSLFVSGLALILTACSTFELVDGNFRPQGKSLAVLSGLSDETTLMTASFLTESLEKNSRFRVISQKQIAQSIPNYPLHIKGPYGPSYIEVDVDYNHTDRNKLADIQKRLGVDYIYVVWAPNAVRYRASNTIWGDVTVLNVVAQFFEYPGGREVGRGFYRPRFDAVKTKSLRKDLDAVAREFAEKTGMAK
jgi:hypothetical protein